MDTRYLGFVDADRDFYDLVWNVPPPEVLGRDVDAPGFGVSTRGPFRIFHSGQEIPPTGWKVHVSCIPSRAEAVVPTVVRLCTERGISCKHLLTRRLVAMNQAKYADPEAAGKVVTAYPTTADELEALVTALRRRLAGEPGGRVLSDLPVPGAPVSIRYGAFMTAYHLDANGRPRAGRAQGGMILDDDRAPHSCPPQDDEPAFVRSIRAEAARRDQTSTLAVQDVRVLHRSNAGGVYAARWTDGRTVALKEARHHTGFDRAESDAVARLRQERSALERLTGTGVVPEVIDYLTVGDSDFLVMEYVDGPPLTRAMATTHPGAVPGADGAAYRRWVREKATQARAAIEVLHRHGVVHLDLQPGNVMDCGNSVRLIDLESCALDGVAVADGVATELSDSAGDTTPAADRRAIDRLESAMLCPTFSMTVRRPELAAEMLTAAEHDLQGTVPGQGPGPCAERLVNGIHLCATPERTDRLFPGDITAFATPGAGTGLLHGAAGVVHALRLTRHPVPEIWNAWLLDHARDAALPGLADGGDGVALALLAIEGPEVARACLPDSLGISSPWWGAGAAGSALARALIGATTDDEALLVQAGTLIGAALNAPTDQPGHCAGLLQGWAGVGLAALRVAESFERVGFPADTEALRAGARRMLERESLYECRSGAMLLTRDGRRGMPYIGRGSAALGLLAAALEGHGLSDATTRRIRAEVSTTVRARCVSCVGLMHGRTGQLLTLATLSGEDKMTSLHQTRLRWHAVPADRSSRRDAPGAAQADFYLGDQNLRSSADLATGAAGVLLAAAGTATEMRDNLVGALFLPHALGAPPEDGREPGQMQVSSDGVTPVIISS